MILLTVVEYFFKFHFWPPRRHWGHLQMILSCIEDQYGRLDILNVKIRPLLKILETEEGAATIPELGWQKFWNWGWEQNPGDIALY